VELHVLPEQIQIHQALAIASQDELPGIAALRHVVGNVNRSNTDHPRHHYKLSENVPSVPDGPDGHGLPDGPTVQVAQLPKDALVEIEAIAAS